MEGGHPPRTPSPACGTVAPTHDIATHFHFDRAVLLAVAERHRREYRTATPFAHVVLDDFLPEALLDAVLDEFPAPGEITWTTYDDAAERKLEGAREWEMGDVTRHLFHEFNGSVFVEFLEALTGIDGVIPDPHLHGGGLHQIERGGFLKVHADFNWNEKLRLDRRLNVLLYLNRDWHDEYGGHLELWDRDMTRCERRILPVFNRCVIFSTTSWANHGHPDALTCPAGRTRKSLALYYYSNGRPAAEIDSAHGTLFAPRPGEVWRRELSSPRLLAKRLVPPLLWDAAKRARKRRARRSG